MARIWSPEELAEADTICRRVAPLLRPDARPVLDATRARFHGDRDEGEARGARFELKMLARLRDEHIREVELERPVAPGVTGCTVDQYLRSMDIGFELKAAQHLIIPFVQVSADCSEDYLEEEHGAAIRQSRNFTEDQAKMLFREVNRKCGEKKLQLLTFPTWLLVDTDGTDWLEHFRSNLTTEEHFRQLGEAFKFVATRAGRNDEPNHVLAAPRVNLGFVNSFRGTAREHLVVFPRSDAEREESKVIARLFGLEMLVT